MCFSTIEISSLHTFLALFSLEKSSKFRSFVDICERKSGWEGVSTRQKDRERPGLRLEVTGVEVFLVSWTAVRGTMEGVETSRLVEIECLGGDEAVCLGRERKDRELPLSLCMCVDIACMEGVTQFRLVPPASPYP